MWGKSPRRRTGESQVLQQPNRGSNLGFPGGNPWARRSRSNPPARGNVCVRISAKSGEHLTPVARERGKRRTDEPAKSGWTKEAAYHLFWMAWRVWAIQLNPCRYQAVKFVRDVPPMAGKADHSPDSLILSDCSAGAGVDRGTKMASELLKCIAFVNRVSGAIFCFTVAVKLPQPPTICWSFRSRSPGWYWYSFRQRCAWRL